ncbi:MAG: hypothetical protein AAB676_04310 [Verrucomicrobiota bacterium]
MMTRQQVTDLYFMEARSKLIDLAAFLDRVERAEGEEDFRVKAFRQALGELSKKAPGKARKALLTFSDPTIKPIAKATTKAACGAWPGTKSANSGKAGGFPRCLQNVKSPV